MDMKLVPPPEMSDPTAPKVGALSLAELITRPGGVRVRGRWRRSRGIQGHRSRLLSNWGRLRIVIRILLAVFLATVPAAVAVPPGGTGSGTLGSGQRAGGPGARGAPRPGKSMAARPAGARRSGKPRQRTPQ